MLKHGRGGEGGGGREREGGGDKKSQDQVAGLCRKIGQDGMRGLPS